jgi:hypothetical protein
MYIYKVTGQCLNPKNPGKDEVLYFTTYEAAEQTALHMCSFYKEVERIEKTNLWKTQSGRIPLFIEKIAICDEFVDYDAEIAVLKTELKKGVYSPKWD